MAWIPSCASRGPAPGVDSSGGVFVALWRVVRRGAARGDTRVPIATRWISDSGWDASPALFVSSCFTGVFDGSGGTCCLQPAY